MSGILGQDAVGLVSQGHINDIKMYACHFGALPGQALDIIRTRTGCLSVRIM